MQYRGVANSWFAIIRNLLLIFLLTLTYAEDVAGQQLGKKTQSLSAKSSTVWDDNNICVCWENPTSANEKEREWVRQAVEYSWEQYANVKFTGWGKCTIGIPNACINIQIKDEGPHVKSLGKDLAGDLHGMVLNFTFKNWNESCASNTEFCIKAIAIHEFGHALGITHEQNRPDAPADCRLQCQGTVGDYHLTAYDMNSVMNYCNPDWNNNGQLSASDIIGIQSLYGEANGRSNQFDWAIFNGNEPILYPGRDYTLFNLSHGESVKNKSRKYGINLVWDEGNDLENIRFQRSSNSNAALRPGERLAIYVKGGGYVRYKKRKYGINLVWSDTPVYEWILRNNLGSPQMRSFLPISLYNQKIDQYLVYCSRSYGLNIKWLKDCESVAEVDPIPPMTVPRPRPGTTGPSPRLQKNGSENQ